MPLSPCGIGFFTQANSALSRRIISIRVCLVISDLPLGVVPANVVPTRASARRMARGFMRSLLPPIIRLSGAKSNSNSLDAAVCPSSFIAAGRKYERNQDDSEQNQGCSRQAAFNSIVTTGEKRRTTGLSPDQYGEYSEPADG